MKSTVVVYGSSTGTCQSIAEQIASKLGVEALEVTNLTADVVAANEKSFAWNFNMGCRRIARRLV